MRISLLLLLLGPALAQGQEVRLSVGMSHDEALAVLRENNAEDITPGLAIVGPGGEWPLHGLVWWFRDYDAVVALSAEDGKIIGLGYWIKSDFGKSKLHRAKTERDVTAITLDTKRRTVKIDLRRPKRARRLNDTRRAARRRG